MDVNTALVQKLKEIVSAQPQYNDLLDGYLGGVSLNDGWDTFLTNEGFTTGTIQDRTKLWFDSLGYTGSLADQFSQFSLSANYDDFATVLHENLLNATAALVDGTLEVTAVGAGLYRSSTDTSSVLENGATYNYDLELNTSVSSRIKLLFSDNIYFGATQVILLENASGTAHTKTGSFVYDSTYPYFGLMAYTAGTANLLKARFTKV